MTVAVAATLTADGSELPLAAPGAGAAPSDATFSALSSAQLSGGGLAVLDKWVSSGGQGLDLAIYDRDGALVSSQEVAFSPAVTNASLIALAGGGMAVAWETSSGAQTQSGFHTYSATGVRTGQASIGQPGSLSGFALPDGGFQLSWGGGTHVYAADGSITAAAPQATPLVFAQAGGGAYLQLQDNALTWFDGAAYAPAITLPGEGAHAVTSAAIATLSGGGMGLIWTDAHGAHTAVYDTVSHTLSAPTLIDVGAASAAAITALPDGGFAVSWQDGGLQKGEAFNAQGQFGPSLYLDGAVAGVTSTGELYTVAHAADGTVAEQHYALSHAPLAAPPPEYDNYLGQAMPQSGGNFDDVTHSVHGPGDGHATIYASSVGPSGVAASGGYNTIIAGDGDNSYWMGPTDTVVVPDGVTGTKTIYEWNSVVMPAGVNNLTFFGAGDWGIGNAMDNLIVMGGNDQNYMNGGAGNDVLVGGFGQNNFGVDAGNGNDVIYNFHFWNDTVRLTGTSFTSFDQIHAAMTQAGADVVLQIDPTETLTFRDMQVSDFQARDFLLPLDTTQLGGLTFDEEFNGLSLLNPADGSGTWRTNFGTDPTSLNNYAIPSNQEEQVYTDPSFTGTADHVLGLNPFSIDNGVLSITAQPVTYQESQYTYGQPYSSGMLNTKGLFQQQYGYFEMRAQLPTELGTWPAFWLAQDPFVPGNEADILEHLAMYPNTAFSRSNDNGWVTSSSLYMNDASGFHTYGMLWTPTNTTFYVDGVGVMELPTPASWDKPMYMILNLAVGGWGGDVDSGALPAQMDVDYIRVYGLADNAQVVDDMTLANGYAQTNSAAYTAPAGVTTIKLTGSAQTVTGNDAGDHFISTNTGNHLIGGAGADLFDVGRSGDVLTGGGGDNTYAYAETPWAGSRITDFVPGHDKIDLTGLMAWVGYTGSDPVGAGYLKIDTDSSGAAEVLVNQNPADAASQWWVVATLPGVAAADLIVSGDLVLGAAPVETAVSVSDPSYSAPAGVRTITLTGSGQTVTGNNAGDTFNSNNSGNHLAGGAGADLFHLGRGGDTVTGGGGADVFAYAENPWAPGHITDFGATDSVDLTGLLARAGYTGSDPIADGYVRIDAAADGSARIWSNQDSVDHSGWWLVATLDHVAASAVRMDGDRVVAATAGGSPTPPPGDTGSGTTGSGTTGSGGSTGSAGSTVSVSDPTYSAPDGVTQITLTGAGQTVTGNNAGDVFFSNNTGNHLTGGTGADTLHLGRGGDVAAGGSGGDTFAFAENPWAAGHITDFGAGDVLQVSGLLQRVGYAGADPLGDGVLKLVSDGAGGTQVWDNLDGLPGQSGQWLITTLDAVAPSSLSYADGGFALAAPAPASALTPAGQTFTSDNNGDHWTGTAGADTFYLGRGGDVVSGGAGADTFIFRENPWAAGHITDFTPGEDKVDLTGLLSRAGFTGTDPVADGFIKITAAGDGSAQIWSNQDHVDHSGWWLVTTLDGVASTAVHMQGAFVTG